VSYTFDANILLYASDDRSPYHSQARGFLDRMASGDEIVYVFWPTVMAYLRISTHPAIFEQPLRPSDAVDNVEQLLALQHVQSVGEQDRFWASYRRVADEADARGNLVPDAHLVALMVENGVRTIFTRDRDYRRFRNIEPRDPFE
jgi:toxin-antitoxin system PIN domain toxin